MKASSKSDFQIAGQDSTFDVKLHPKGEYIYTTGYTNNDRFNLKIVAKQLAPQVGKDKVVLNLPVKTANSYGDKLSLDPNGKFLYLVRFDDNQILTYTIDENYDLHQFVPETIAQ